MWKRDDYYQSKECIVNTTKYKIRKTNKFCTNYGIINHNVETCKKKE